MPVVNAQAIQKSYGTRAVLKTVTLTIMSGERVGLVGNNGTGKSTLARILSGTEAPDAGAVNKRRGAEILVLEQVPTFEGNPSAHAAVAGGLKAWSDAVNTHTRICDALASGKGNLEVLLAEQETAGAEVERLGGWQRSHEVDAVLGHLGIARPEQPISTMSGGERRRVALARILVARPTLAILDEPTNHLDAETIEWLEEYLIDEYPGALLLITHDRYLLDRVSERTLELDLGEVYAYAGGYGLYLEQKAERLVMLARTEQNRQNFLRREIEWLRRQPKARTTKQKARIERAEAAQAAPAPKAERTAMLKAAAGESGKTLLELRDFSLQVADRTLIQDLSLFLTKGERIGIIGRNGTGKTSLLRAILGEIAPLSGQVVVGQNTKLGYFDQERGGLANDKTIYENVIGDSPRIELGGTVIEPYSYLERFLFDRHAVRQPVSSLSGGERARVLLAKLLRDSSNLLLLDEPTNDLDVATLGALEAMLSEFEGTALIVTHDRWFLDRVATSILSFEGDGKVVRTPGNYDTYRRLKAEALELKASEAKQQEPRRSAPAADAKRAPKTKAGLTSAEDRELSGLFGAIEAAENRVGALTDKLALPETYAGSGEEARRLNGELAAARAEVERLTARWEALEQKRTAT